MGGHTVLTATHKHGLNATCGYAIHFTIRIRVLRAYPEGDRHMRPMQEVICGTSEYRNNHAKELQTDLNMDLDELSSRRYVCTEEQYLAVICLYSRLGT